MATRGPGTHEVAVAFEQAGRLAEAVQAYLEAGAVEPAARVLSAMGRWGDAARLLLTLVPGAPVEEARRLTYHAAVCLAHAGDRPGAAALLRSIGDEVRARAVLGLPVEGLVDAPRSAPPSSLRAPSAGLSGAPAGLEEAAYQARAAGRREEAAALFVRADLPYEAGVTLLEAGDEEGAMLQFVSVPPSSPRYRAACVRAIALAVKKGTLPFEVDRLVTEFLRVDPGTSHEVDALYALGVLYEGTGFDDEAREAFERVLRAAPDHEAARARLARPVGEPAAGHDFAAVLEEDLSFWAPGRRTVPEGEPDEPARSLVASPPEVAPSAPAPASVSVPVSFATEPAPAPASAALPRGAGSGALAKGTVVGGRYAIEAEIGRGGMGVVYRAHDRELGEIVALKTFLDRVDDPHLVARFKQELTLTRQLTHENVIRLHDMGIHGGCRFITMELLTGDSLKTKVGVVGLAEAVGYLSQIAGGLDAIHRRGIIHRDLKPANVFVTADDVAKIMDFGLAKKQDAPDGLTASGFMAGTPGYMPPEQVTSFGTVTAAADLYAFGATAYELITGHRPFRHKDPSQVIRLQFTTEAQPVRELVPAVPPALDACIMQLLDRDPARRPGAARARATLEEAAAALAHEIGYAR